MKYRKKPVVIEAKHYDGSEQSALTIIEWAFPHIYFVPPVLKIKTLEGTMDAPVGWWIIKGVQSEFYGCKPDIFEATYEVVSDEED